MDSTTQTLQLLEQWHGGDRDALDKLLERDLPWIREFVTHRVGDWLLERADPDDYVQEAVIQALRYTPKFVISDRRQFRSLVARIAENVIRDHAAGLRAQKRDIDREREVPSDSVLHLDPPADGEVTRPSIAANRNEEHAWLQLAMELLPTDDRQIVRLRQFEERSFPEIGEMLELTEDAARMRFKRGVRRLASLVIELRAGRLPDALGH